MTRPGVAKTMHHALNETNAVSKSAHWKLITSSPVLAHGHQQQLPGTYLTLPYLGCRKVFVRLSRADYYTTTSALEVCLSSVCG